MTGYIVDYFSFSIPTPRLLAQWDIAAEHNTPFDVDERTGGIGWLLASQSNWTEIQKSGIFDRGIRFPDIGVSYFDGHKSHVSLVQVSGSGCAWFREEDHLETLINDWTDRCTRIDIALDIETDVEPEIFAKSKSNGRFKPSQHIERSSGITWYVGSRESDRHARVYRYNPPHPRHDKLRVEYQLADEQAKLASQILNLEGVDALGDKLSSLFGWNHPCFLATTNAPRLPSSKRPETKGNTIFWLYKQVLPALKKSAEKGDIETLIAFESSVRAIIDEYQEKRRN